MENVQQAIQSMWDIDDETLQKINSSDIRCSSAKLFSNVFMREERMRNFVLQHCGHIIPFVRELMPMGRSVTGCIVMQQLDFYFAKKPDGFYYYQQPCNQPWYVKGESWEERIGISAQEFRTVFDKFGIRYKSRKEFDAAPDKFQGKYFACYTDKRRFVTWYFRNHELMDQDLYTLLVEKPAKNVAEHTEINGYPIPTTQNRGGQSPVSRDTQFTVNSDTQYRVNSDTPVTVNGDPQHHTSCAPQPPEIAMDKSGITKKYREVKKQLQQTKTTQPPSQVVESEGCSSDNLQNEMQELVFPAKALPVEVSALKDILALCPIERRQQVLDEVEGKLRAGKVTTGIVPLAASLVKAVANGSFNASAGIVVAAGRQAAAATQERLLQAEMLNQIDVSLLDPEIIAKLPPTIRAKTLAAQGKTR